MAEAVRCGWADVGVCVRLVSEEANLKFLSLRWESYDLYRGEPFRTETTFGGARRRVRQRRWSRRPHWRDTGPEFGVCEAPGVFARPG